MEIIKQYQGAHPEWEDAQLILFKDGYGYYVSETGSDWEQVKIAELKDVTDSMALEYVEDIANHAPQKYIATLITWGIM